MKNYNFDLDGDHTVSREELQVAVEKNCKRSISLAEIEGILSKADLNQSGALDFGEFLEQIFNIVWINLINPQAPFAQKIADQVVFRRFQGEGVEFF